MKPRTTSIALTHRGLASWALRKRSLLSAPMVVIELRVSRRSRDSTPRTCHTRHLLYPWPMVLPAGSKHIILYLQIAERGEKKNGKSFGIEWMSGLPLVMYRVLLRRRGREKM